MKKVATFAERLKEAIGDLSYSDVGKSVGLSKQAISTYVTGIREPKKPTIAALASALDVNPAWLCGLDAPKTLPRSNSDQPLDLYSIPGIIPIPKMRKVPLIGSIACGVPILAEENIESYLDMPDGLHADFALRCKGDSMINARIQDGDLVYIRKQPQVENGEIAAVLIDGEATLKRVYIKQNSVMLVAENTAYDPMVYTNGNCDDFRILGKAIVFQSTVK